mmetsp:Transcript_95539/g.270253  ORF Transcript_95539/g.270253 Transcript_95539/m.270253 type:complete len:251 (-) Transcript_95539:1222-1974(-)
MAWKWENSIVPLRILSRWATCGKSWTNVFQKARRVSVSTGLVFLAWRSSAIKHVASSIRPSWSVSSARNSEYSDGDRNSLRCFSADGTMLKTKSKKFTWPLTWMFSLMILLMPSRSRLLVPPRPNTCSEARTPRRSRRAVPFTSPCANACRMRCWSPSGCSRKSARRTSNNFFILDILVKLADEPLDRAFNFRAFRSFIACSPSGTVCFIWCRGLLCTDDDGDGERSVSSWAGGSRRNSATGAVDPFTSD